MALDAPITAAELHDALQHMPSKKAPGPDGFPTDFYKKFDVLLFLQNSQSSLTQAISIIIILSNL